jgi:hypothetical protein
MSYINFTKIELAAAVARGVRQCVVIAPRPQVQEALSASSNPSLRVFAVDEEVASDSSATFVPTRFAGQTLAAALGNRTSTGSRQACSSGLVALGIALLRVYFPALPLFPRCL